MYDKILTYVAGRFKVVTTLFAFVSQQDLFRTMVPVGLVLGIGAVSYTHLDVYKRQAQEAGNQEGCHDERRQ